MKAKGYNFSAVLNFSECGGTAYDFSISGYSSSATSMLSQLKSLIVSYDPLNDQEFFNSLNDLQQQSLNLSGNEKYTVGIPVTVAIYSFTYWKNNANRWASQLKVSTSESAAIANRTKDHNVSGPYATDIFKPCPVNLWKLGGADVGGAVTGATAGVLAGPGGAFAAGVLNSAVSSAGNLSNQVISCYVSWWPF